MYITSQFCWVGGVQGIGTLFQKIDVLICHLWFIEVATKSNVVMNIAHPWFYCNPEHISFKMTYYIEVYVNYWQFCGHVCYSTPENKAEFIPKNVLGPISESTWPEVGKLSWWSETLHVNLELMWDHENI